MTTYAYIAIGVCAGWCLRRMDSVIVAIVVMFAAVMAVAAVSSHIIAQAAL